MVLGVEHRRSEGWEGGREGVDGVVDDRLQADREADTDRHTALGLWV